ncbi:MAG TPA: hypothetical protein VF342_01165 [Alphaproteobacteria bacterium]
MRTGPDKTGHAFSLRVVQFLTVAVATVLLALAFRPAEHVFDMPLTEDGYYSLSVARNLAEGRGPTIDGTNLTNGFQPLFTIIESAAFALARGDTVSAMRLVLAFAWLFHAAGALMIALVARDAWPAVHGEAERASRGWLAAFLYLAAPLMLNHAYNGLETGCVMFLYAACWRWMQTERDEGWGGLAVFGVLIGLMVLARIDAAFMALVLGLNELRRSRRRGFGTMLVRGALLGGAAFVISAPWWLYNLVHFGSPMPTSGTAQQEWAFEWIRLEHAEWALRLVLMPWLFVGAHEQTVGVWVPWAFSPTGEIRITAIGVVRGVLLAGLAVAAWHWWRQGAAAAELAEAGPAQRRRTRRTLEFAACLGAALAALVVYYMLSFVAYWFYYRYFAPAALFAFVVVPIILGRVFAGIARPAVRTIAGLVVVALAVQIATLTVLARAGRGLGGNTVYHDQVALVRQYVPDGDYVAAGQSGTLGFFRDRVVNTDGKVNRAALAYQDHMWDYLRERDVKWFVDWPHYVQKYLGVPIVGPGDRPAAQANGWRLVAERNDFYLYEYVGTGVQR